MTGDEVREVTLQNLKLCTVGAPEDSGFSSEQAGQPSDGFASSFFISWTHLGFFPHVFAAYRSGLDGTDSNDTPRLRRLAFESWCCSKLQEARPLGVTSPGPLRLVNPTSHTCCVMPENHLSPLS